MKHQLGNLEEEVLLIVMYLEEAYGVSVAIEYKEQCGVSISIPAIHTVLTRLESKGYVTSSMGEPTPERGGKRKRIYEATKLGYKVINSIRDSRMQLWSRVPSLKPLKG